MVVNRRHGPVAATSVHVYDPNLNPYGHELSCLLAGNGIKVNWWAVADTRRSSPQEVVTLARLGPGRDAASLPALIWKRFWGPLAYVLSARRETCLVCWVRDPWDAAVFGIRARLGLPTVVVYHNPRQLRPRAGLAGRMEQWLLARSRVVVHSEWLRSVVEGDFPEAAVAAHPPYAQTVAAAGVPERVEVAKDVFALVGALRPDKGVDNLVGLAQATARPWTLRVIGPDRLPPTIETALKESHVEVEYPDQMPPSDAELARLLSSSAALIAPYTAPTTSGSVFMALTLGVPVLGLTSKSFTDIVPSANQADDVASLAGLMDDFQPAEWRSVAKSRSDLADSAAAAWTAVVRSA